MINQPLLLWVTSVLNFQKNTPDSSEVHTDPELNLNDRLGAKENTFVSSDSVYLTDLLLNLNYDPMQI